MGRGKTLKEPQILAESISAEELLHALPFNGRGEISSMDALDYIIEYHGVTYEVARDVIFKMIEMKKLELSPSYALVVLEGEEYRRKGMHISAQLPADLAETDDEKARVHTQGSDRGTFYVSRFYQTELVDGDFAEVYMGTVKKFLEDEPRVAQGNAFQVSIIA